MRGRFFTMIELAVVVVATILMFVLVLPAASAARVRVNPVCTANLMALGQAVEMYRLDNDQRFMLTQLPAPKGGGSYGPNWATLLACTSMGNYVKASALVCPDMPAYLPDRWKDPKYWGSKYSWMWLYPAYGYNALWAGGVRRGTGGYTGAMPYTIASVEEPDKLLLLADSAAPGRKHGGAFLWPSYTDKETVLWPRHNGAVNVLYADGHVAATEGASSTCDNKASAALYAKGAELESSATCPRMKCRWRMDLD